MATKTEPAVGACVADSLPTPAQKRNATQLLNRIDSRLGSAPAWANSPKYQSRRRRRPKPQGLPPPQGAGLPARQANGKRTYPLGSNLRNQHVPGTLSLRYTSLRYQRSAWPMATTFHVRRLPEELPEERLRDHETGREHRFKVHAWLMWPIFEPRPASPLRAYDEEEYYRIEQELFLGVDTGSHMVNCRHYPGPSVGPWARFLW